MVDDLGQIAVALFHYDRDEPRWLTWLRGVTLIALIAAVAWVIWSLG